MTVSGSDIRRLEKLARIELEPGERERLGLQLDRIVDFVRILQIAQAPVGAQAEQSAGHAKARGEAPLDADLPGRCLDRGEVLAAAPAHEDGLFRVPRVIDTEGT